MRADWRNQVIGENTDDILDLEKAFELNLEKAQFPTLPVMATHLAVDCSTSMREEFMSGWVDHMIKCFYVAAMKFDDDKTLEVCGFNEHLLTFPSITEFPKDLYTSEVGMRPNGGTCFAPVVKQFVPSPVSFLKGLFSKPTAKKYLGMITDGDSYDRGDFEQVLAKLEKDKLFIQLIAIGNQLDMDYLRAVSGSYQNIGLIHFPDPFSVDNNAFFEALCNDKFKTWLEIYKD